MHTRGEDAIASSVLLHLAMACGAVGNALAAAAGSSASRREEGGTIARLCRMSQRGPARSVARHARMPAWCDACVRA